MATAGGDVTVLLAAAVVLLRCLCSAQPDAVSCEPPGANVLSRVTFFEPSPPQPAVELAPAVWGQPSERLYIPENEPVVSSSGLIRPGTWAQYSCDPGYVLVGDSVRTCLRDGQWTGTAPLCYLNVAESSSLTLGHGSLVDGDLTSSDDLLALFEGGQPLFADLYFLFPLVEMRIITFYNLTGLNIQIRLSADNVSWIGISMEVEAPQQTEREQALAVHAISLRNTVLEDGVRYIKVSLFHSSGTYFQRASYSPVWPLHELQIVAESTGLSKHQCLDDTGRPNVAETWAAGDRCYHLVNSRATRQEAEDECHRLGAEGTLFRDESEGLSAMARDILRRGRRLRQIRMSDVWIGGGSDIVPDPGAAVTAEGSGMARPRRCRALRRRRGWADTAVECGAWYRFICQRAPRVCGSPAQEPSLIYIEPRPKVEGETINVTCSDPSLTGRIKCGSRHWTQPTFCHPSPTVITHHVVAQQDSSGETMPKVQSYLGAIIGGAIGGALVLAAIAIALVCNTRKRQDNKLTTEPYNFMEFWGLNHNPIYKSDEEENVYSEVGVVEAIYEEPRFPSGHRKKRSSGEPPPLPSSRPSCSTLETDVAASVAADESDYEVFSPQTAVEPGPAPAGREAEYSVPLVAGRKPAAVAANAGFCERPADGAPSSVCSEDPYAVPYDAKTDDAADDADSRRSVPDVAAAAMRQNEAA